MYKVITMKKDHKTSNENVMLFVGIKSYDNERMGIWCWQMDIRYIFDKESAISLSNVNSSVSMEKWCIFDEKTQWDEQVGDWHIVRPRN